MKIPPDISPLSAMLIISLSLIMLPACVPIGVLPWSDGGEVRYIKARIFVRNIDEHTESLLTPGQTSRKDVVLILGEPDYVYNDEYTFIYEGEITPGGRVWKMGYMSPIGLGSGPWYPFEYERYRLTIQFDDFGQVESSKFKRSRLEERYERN